MGYQRTLELNLTIYQKKILILGLLFYPLGCQTGKDLCLFAMYFLYYMDNMIHYQFNFAQIISWKIFFVEVRCNP